MQIVNSTSQTFPIAYKQGHIDDSVTDAFVGRVLIHVNTFVGLWSHVEACGVVHLWGPNTVVQSLHVFSPNSSFTENQI